MAWRETKFEGAYLYEPKVFGDDRGYFFESFNQSTLPDTLKHIQFVQDNESSSIFGVIRGLHYQIPPFAQSKLVRCVVGQVMDVIVDIRPGSATYGQHEAFLLSSDNKLQLFVPQGFAHGYSVISETAIFAYKCDQYYNKASEGGISPMDKDLDIMWGIEIDKAILSEKDILLPAFGDNKPFERI